MSNFALRLRRVRTIAWKELVDFVRDWRTLVAVIVIPLLIFPLLFFALPKILQMEAEERQANVLDIIIQGDSPDQDLFTLFDESLLNYSSESLPNGLDGDLSQPMGDDERLRNMEVSAILRLQHNQTNGTWNYAILRDSTQELSGEAFSRILEDLKLWESNLTNETLVANGLDPEDTLNPIRWSGDSDNADVASDAEQAGWALSLFIPMIVAMWTASSAIQPSIDMTAGERERGTMEAVLCLPVKRFDLLAGKWLAVATISGTGVILQVVGLLFAVQFITSSNSFLQMPALSTSAFLLLLAAVLLFTVMVVAFELALAVRSRSVKEAGSVLGPMIILIIFPALFAQFINLEGIEGFWFAIPVVNILLAMRELLTDRVISGHVLIWFGSSLVYALLAAWYASKQFNREDLVESIS
ncbi:ABC transporter permease subunit [Deltaproteobacteria bacterium]|nr:ABC transporter permease subunit [Deltaproteobacteria bacterium]